MSSLLKWCSASLKRDRAEEPVSITLSSPPRYCHLLVTPSPPCYSITSLLLCHLLVTPSPPPRYFITSSSLLHHLLLLVTPSPPPRYFITSSSLLHLLLLVTPSLPPRYYITSSLLLHHPPPRYSITSSSLLHHLLLRLHRSVFAVGGCFYVCVLEQTWKP